MQPYAGGYKAAEREAALLEAERTLVRPGPNDDKRPRLLLKQIETRAALFQPREIALGQKLETDEHHVKKLKRRSVDEGGQLDPIVVVKLADTWVVVDGHHRLAVYKEQGRQEPIECRWFAGTARDAMDASISHNKKLHLEASWWDRHEAAWQRVLIGGWSNKRIRKACSIGSHSVTNMRKALKLFRSKDKRNKEAKRFRAALAERGIHEKDIKDYCWADVKHALYGEKPTYKTREQKAQALAMLMRDRLSRKLSTEDPEIVAMALQRYDRNLPAKLGATRAWREACGDEFDYVEEAAAREAQRASTGNGNVAEEF